jgi:hypothetical protein
MKNLLKPALLSAGLLVAATVAAPAQTVSSLPQNSAPTQSATTAYTSTARIVPDPGGSVSIKSQPAQSAAKSPSNWTDHPYSGAEDGAKSGPKPN